ncbi:MAG: response regulator [Nitrospina sp.]|nr:MAG: response regulator [Nitrospina sp.]
MRDTDSILIIEDESLVVETLKGNFQDNGYHISTASSGEEGIRKFQNDNFDLVITDLKLKGMNGLQVSRKIKKINPDTPIIVVTGHPKLLSPEEATRFGVHDLVLKPFTWAQIYKKVTDCLDPRESAAPSKEPEPWLASRKRNTPVARLGHPESKHRKDPYQNLSQFLSGQTRVLEMLIRGEPWKDILNTLVFELESCSDEAVGSIHLLNEDKTQLDCMAGPSLPGPLLREIASVSLEEGMNPWGTAATQNKPIIVEDIRKSRLWERCSAPAKICGFRASWSFPLRGSDMQAAGILTFYIREARPPSSAELKWILSATRLVGILMEYKSLESALTRAERQAKSFNHPGHEAVVTFNDKGVIDSFNGAAADLFGYPGKTLIGRNIKQLVTGHHRSHSHHPFQKLNHGGNGEHGILKAAAMGIRKDGSRLFLDLAVGELVQETGRKFVATLTDISKLKYAENVLKETRHKPEELNETGIDRTLSVSGREPSRKYELSGQKGRREFKSLQEQLVQSEKWAVTGKLAASLAHEFKNPLFGILNVLEKAAREFSLKQGSEDLLELAIRECYRVMDLVEKMQDVHRPSSHSPKLMDVHSAINDMVLLTRSRMDKRKIELELDLSSSLPKIYGMEDQIRQVVLNLLNNAEEALPEDHGKILIRTRALESSLEIMIQDNGKGIPESQRQTIFEPFYTTKKDSRGMGLGLPISYGIIKAHGGRIDVEPGIGGQGTSFIVTLPKRTSRNAIRSADQYVTSTTWN